MINGSPSFEMLSGRKYTGKVALWGETVLFKDVTAFKYKGEPVYKHGMGVGKSSWSDSHICLTRTGAVEACSIRRLRCADVGALSWPTLAIRCDRGLLASKDWLKLKKGLLVMSSSRRKPKPSEKRWPPGCMVQPLVSRHQDCHQILPRTNRGQDTKPCSSSSNTSNDQEANRLCR